MKEISVETQLIDIVIQDRAGNVHAVAAESGMSLMEVIRDNGFDELMALCGGSCSCATCHVHIDPAFLTVLPPVSELENDLLDSSDRRDERSRLACQVPITPALDGLRVAIAPED
jgi:2Fe-2S ferredoxin